MANTEQPKYALNDDELILMGARVETWHPLQNQGTRKVYIGRVFDSEFFVKIYRCDNGKNGIAVTAEGLRDYMGIRSDIPLVDVFLLAAYEQECERLKDNDDNKTLEEAVQRARKLIGK